MSDFDFEELDRAIAGSMGDEGSSGSIQNSLSERGANKSPSSARPSTPASKRGSAGVNASGLHSSVSTGRTVRPMQDIIPAAIKKVDTSKNTGEDGSDVKSAAPKRQPGRVMDFMGSAKRPIVKRSSTTYKPEESSEPTPAVDNSKDEPVPAYAPLESPFLPDAKVEKRPLGGFGPVPPLFKSGPEPFSGGKDGASAVGSLSDDIDEILTMPDFDANMSSPNDAANFFGYNGGNGNNGDDSDNVTEPSAPRQSFNIPETTSEPLNTLAESSAKFPEAPVASSVPEAPVSNSVPDDTYDGVDVNDDDDDDEPLLLEEPEDFFLEANAGPSNNLDESKVTLGDGSINKQYTEEPRTDESSGDMYDTETYHQPISAPPKKRSKFVILAWVLALVAVGAGLGAAFYLLVLPNL